MNDLTHASFFSGVGGLDLGLERAGWRTVSFSEIDPYASAVLAERWPGVPNLGSIVELASEGVRVAAGQPGRSRRGSGPVDGGGPDAGGASWHAATLWTGGFPCQDLSVAGKRRGMGTHEDRLDTRSGLAYAFLDLVERHRPPAVLLENVPGLLSSHGGRDFGALLGRLGELGYGWAYRVLDAQHFGVPQRRRRVFILALRRGGHPDADGAAEVLAVGTRCGRDHAAEREAWARAAGRTAESFERPGWGGITHALGAPGSTGRLDPNGESFVVRPSPDAGRNGAPDGLAGRLDDRRGVAFTKHSRYGENGDPRRPNGSSGETWGPAEVTGTLDSIGHTARTATLVAATLNSGGNDGGFRTEPDEHLVMGTIREHVRPGSNTDHSILRTADGPDDPLLPLGLDSHRYRCCGNGVVAPVAEWLGARIAAWAAA